MAKIFEVIKTGTNAITIASSSYQLVTVPITHECRVGAITVKQVASADGGGTAVAFTIDMLKSNMGIAVDSNIANATALPNNIALYRVFDQKTGAAGAVVSEFTPAVGGDGYLFRNVDGTQTEPQRKAYLLIRPTSAGTSTKWEYAITTIADVGN